MWQDDQRRPVAANDCKGVCAFQPHNANNNHRQPLSVPRFPGYYPSLQGSWNAAAAQYQYGYRSTPELRLVGFPATSDVGRSAMLHDGGTYRFYFETL